MAQVALLAAPSNGLPVIPIIGARKVYQLQDPPPKYRQFGSSYLRRTMKKPSMEPSQIDLGFPQSIYERKEMVRAIRYGGRVGSPPGCRVTDLFRQDVRTIIISTMLKVPRVTE